MQYRPDHILVQEQALAYPRCQKILHRYKTVDRTVVRQSLDKLPGEASDVLSRGKRILYLKEFKGAAFKKCPGFSDHLLCCNYYVFDLVENCPLECSYCILQVFLNRPVITFHVNVDPLVHSMVDTIKSNPQQPFRIGTGEHSDSLALDHIFGVNPYLVETFSRLDNATLELKTKTSAVDSLLGLKHNGRTVVAWSLNPEEIINSNEHKTASLQERLNAAAKLCRDGYKVGFHFDPLIHYPDWKKGYQATVEKLFEVIDPGQIAWISLGTLRYIPKLKQIAEERFPKTAIFANEFVPAPDGKMRYIKPIRKSMLASMTDWITGKAPEVPLYLCMERHEMWGRVFPACPTTPAELEQYLSSHL